MALSDGEHWLLAARAEQLSGLSRRTLRKLEQEGRLRSLRKRRPGGGQPLLSYHRDDLARVAASKDHERVVAIAEELKSRPEDQRVFPFLERRVLDPEADAAALNLDEIRVVALVAPAFGGLTETIDRVLAPDGPWADARVWAPAPSAASAQVARERRALPDDTPAKPFPVDGRVYCQSVARCPFQGEGAPWGYIPDVLLLEDFTETLRRMRHLRGLGWVARNLVEALMAVRLVVIADTDLSPELLPLLQEVVGIPIEGVHAAVDLRDQPPAVLLRRPYGRGGQLSAVQRRVAEGQTVLFALESPFTAHRLGLLFGTEDGAWCSVEHFGALRWVRNLPKVGGYSMSLPPALPVEEGHVFGAYSGLNGATRFWGHANRVARPGPALDLLVTATWGPTLPTDPERLRRMIVSRFGTWSSSSRLPGHVAAFAKMLALVEAEANAERREPLDALARVAKARGYRVEISDSEGGSTGAWKGTKAGAEQKRAAALREAVAIIRAAEAEGRDHRGEGTSWAKAEVQRLRKLGLDFAEIDDVAERWSSVLSWSRRLRLAVTGRWISMLPADGALETLRREAYRRIGVDGDASGAAALVDALGVGPPWLLQEGTKVSVGRGDLPALRFTTGLSELGADRKVPWALDVLRALFVPAEQVGGDVIIGSKDPEALADAELATVAAGRLLERLRLESDGVSICHPSGTEMISVVKR